MRTRGAAVVVILLALALAGVVRADPGPTIEPRPLPVPVGSVVAGPYLLGPTHHGMVIQWEVEGEKAGAVVLKVGDGAVRRIEGRLQAAPEILKSLTGRVYRAVATDLSPCTLYQYRVEPFEEGFPHHFRTPPPPGEFCSAPLTIAALGDTRANPDRHLAVIRRLAPHDPELVLNSGDIVNFAKEVPEWRQFFEVEAELLANAALALAPGNHEGYLGMDFGKAMMERYFGIPGRAGSGHYSFDFGPVHVVVLDPYWGEDLKKEGKAWLDKDLAAVPAGRFKLVLIHTPPYSFGRHTVYPTAKGLREVIRKHRVHAVFAGHAHCYEHFLVDGTHYLTLGGGGASFHKPNMKVIKEEQHLQLSSGAFHHFLLIDVHPEGLRMRVINTDEDKVHEEWKIER